MANVKDIVQYAKSDARNKIVLCNTCIEELQYKDIGFELSSIIANSPDSIYGNDIIHRLMTDATSVDRFIGKYLAIKNIGILFEDELQLNLHSVFDTYSKDQTLVICAEGRIEDDAFLFYGEKRFSIDMKGLSYYNLTKNLIK